MPRIKTTFFEVVILGVLIILFNSCNKKVIPPVESTLDSLLFLPPSKLVVPVTLEVAKLEQVINEKIKGKFIKKEVSLNDKRDKLYIEVTKIQRIKLAWAMPMLSYTLPVHISGKVTKYVAGVKIHNETPIQMDVILHLETEVRLDKRWNLSPKTKLKKIVWKKDPKLKVGVVYVNLRKPIETIIENEQKSFLSHMDASLKQHLPTRKIISKLWNDIQKPIRINQKIKEVWLTTRAENITGSFIDAGSHFIAMQVALSSRTHFKIDKQRKPAINKQLPDFKQKLIKHDSVTIIARGQIPFKMINELLSAELLNTPLSAKGFITTITEVVVYASAGGAIAIKLGVKGDVDGTIYIEGKPFFDPKTRIMKVIDLDYQLETESSLMWSSNWLVHESVLGVVSGKLSLELGPLFDKIPGVIDQAVSKGNLGEKIDLEIEDLQVDLDQLLVTKKDIQLIAIAHGHAGIDIQKKVFAKNKK